MSLELEYIWDAMKETHYKRQLEKLHEEIPGMSSSGEVLEAALNMVVKAIHAEAGTFWFYDRFGDDRIHPMAVYGGGDMKGISLAPGEGVAGQVIESGTSVLIPNCQKDPRWAGKVDQRTGFSTRTMICVPLSISGSLFGSIQIINKSDHLPFDKKDLAFAEKLAESVSELLSDQELLQDYVAHVRGFKGDGISFEALMCAPTRQEMENLLRKVDSYRLLVYEDKFRVLELAGELYEIFQCSKKST